MCTRYYVELSPELRPYIEEARRSPLKESMVRVLGREFKPEGEIRPTDMAAVIAPSADLKRTAFPMVWGYHVPGINRPILNARLESAKYKKTFAEDWKKHRCIIPASWYFEWEHIMRPDGSIKRGAKYAIQPKDSNVTWLAGLYRIEEERGFRYPVFVVLTRTPPEDLLRIHDRMPLVLPPAAADEWIRPDSDPDKTAGSGLTDMVFEKVQEPL